MAPDAAAVGGTRRTAGRARMFHVKHTQMFHVKHRGHHGRSWMFHVKHPRGPGGWLPRAPRRPERPSGRRQMAILRDVRESSR
ncbi:hypothetical protein SFR_3708 [Streptomyces sp. FR-008]|nr:hypothetical protein SFR_3708 [Streptomyces sp. FR-008]